MKGNRLTLIVLVALVLVANFSVASSTESANMSSISWSMRVVIVFVWGGLVVPKDNEAASTMPSKSSPMSPLPEATSAAHDFTCPPIANFLQELLRLRKKRVDSVRKSMERVVKSEVKRHAALTYGNRVATL